MLDPQLNQISVDIEASDLVNSFCEFEFDEDILFVTVSLNQIPEKVYQSNQTFLVRLSDHSQTSETEFTLQIDLQVAQNSTQN